MNNSRKRVRGLELKTTTKITRNVKVANPEIRVLMFHSMEYVFYEIVNKSFKLLEVGRM